MFGRLVELVVWLRGQFRAETADVAVDAFDTVVRVMYHVGRVETLEEVYEGLREAGLDDAADAAAAALEIAQGELREALSELEQYRYAKQEIKGFKRITLVQEKAKA